MNFIARLFGQRKDPLDERANNLVSAARMNATAAYASLSKQHPILLQTEINSWDFIITIAGVFIASTRLNNLRIGGDREDRLMAQVANDLNTWDQNAIGAFEDCKELFEREFDRLSAIGHDPKFVASDALGLWIVWNLFNRRPHTGDEIALVRSVGALVTHAFFTWWTI